MSLSATAWIALSFVDDAVLLYLAARGRAATSSEGVVPSITLEKIMTAKQTRTEEQKIAEIMAALKANRGVRQPTNVVTQLTDAAAGLGSGAARIAAGFAAAKENAAIAYANERERQTRRTAEQILALAQ